METEVRLLEIMEARDWKDDLERVLEDYRYDEKDSCRPWWKRIRLDDILLQ